MAVQSSAAVLTALGVPSGAQSSAAVLVALGVPSGAQSSASCNTTGAFTLTDHKPLKVASGGLASHDPTTDTQHLRATAFANVAALPAAAANERRIVWVQSTDAGARLCVSNGANWVYADSQGTTAID